MNVKVRQVRRKCFFLIICFCAIEMELRKNNNREIEMVKEISEEELIWIYFILNCLPKEITHNMMLSV